MRWDSATSAMTGMMLVSKGGGNGGRGVVGKGEGEGKRGKQTSQRGVQQSQPEITREGGQRRGKTTNGNMSDAGDHDVLL